VSSLPSRFYSISDNPLPHHRSAWYKWEQLGLVKLHRIGGKTLVDDLTIADIVSGRIKLPAHSIRRHPIKPKSKPRGRPRKPRPEGKQPQAKG
jgi:hypothetical protein